MNYPSKKEAIEFVKYFHLSEYVDVDLDNFIYYITNRLDMELKILKNDLFYEQEYTYFMFFKDGDCWAMKPDLRYSFDVTYEWDEFSKKKAEQNEVINGL